jgi:fatty-acyl-CoA synthase
MSTEVGELKNSEEKGGPSMYNLSFDWLEKRDLLAPNKVAMEDLAQGVKLTYREFNIRCNRLANAFRESLGVKKGDRIAILALNCFQYLEALFAVGKIGAILVPVNIRLTGKEIKYIFDNS